MQYSPLPNLNNMSNDSAQYSKLFEEAEKSVSVIKDEKLRQIAFEKLLTHLLGGSDDQESGEGERVSEVQKTIKQKKSVKKKGDSKPKASKGGPRAWLDELVDEDFFNEPRSAGEILIELKSRSHHLKPNDITSPLQKICHAKLLRRKTEISKASGKSAIHWVNW